jgi:glutaconate CoA-transferase subunit A
VTDPYTGEEVVAIQAIRPDVAIIHVQEADDAGNGRIIGTRFEDVLMAQAARRVILTAERIVDGESFAAAPETVAIPGFLVDAVVAAPRGAWPVSGTPPNGFDAAFISAWVAVARDPEAARDSIAERILGVATLA